jgi:hypothetical protein
MIIMKKLSLRAAFLFKSNFMVHLVAIDFTALGGFARIFQQLICNQYLMA